jgi:Na+/glutamate symporter
MDMNRLTMTMPIIALTVALSYSLSHKLNSASLSIPAHPEATLIVENQQRRMQLRRVLLSSSELSLREMNPSRLRTTPKGTKYSFKVLPPR